MPSALYTSVTVVCPECGREKKFYFAPIDRCKNCGSEYPDETRQLAETSLAQDKAQRPPLLTVGMYVSASIASLCLLMVACAIVDVGEYSFNNELVTGPQFLVIAGLPLTAVGLTTFGIAYALFRNLWWSRRLIVITVIANSLIGMLASVIASVSVLPNVTVTLVVGGPLLAYLFYNPKVAAYYDARRPLQAARNTPAPGAEPKSAH